jgi:hypothetical protein
MKSMRILLSALLLACAACAASSEEESSQSDEALRDAELQAMCMQDCERAYWACQAACFDKEGCLCQCRNSSLSCAKSCGVRRGFPQKCPSNFETE